MSENRKIRGATPTEYGGRRYRSKMEATFARLLDMAGLDYAYEAEKWELVPAQEYRGEKVRPVTYTPDFIVEGIVVEVKGWRNDVFPLKRKLIIKYINERRPGTVFVEARSLSDMAGVVDMAREKKSNKKDNEQRPC